MSPIEIENSSFLVREEPLIYDNNCETLGFETGCDIKIPLPKEQNLRCSEANVGSKTVCNLESDELLNLFKLAVIFTRGNPFDSRKHWRMHCEFLETNLKIGCLGTVGEVGEESTNSLKDISAAVSKKKPDVRFIHVVPRKNSAVPGTNENAGTENGSTSHQVCTDIPGRECNMKNSPCEFGNASATPINPHSGKISGHRTVTYRSRHTNLVPFKEGDHTGITVEDAHSFNEKKLLSTSIRPGISHMSTTVERCTRTHYTLGPVQNESRSPVRPSTARLGFFTKAIRRFMPFFRRNKIAVLP